MIVHRSTLKTAPETQSTVRRDGCLDCATCRGLCWSRAELAIVPDRILNTDRTARA